MTGQVTQTARQRAAGTVKPAALALCLVLLGQAAFAQTALGTTPNIVEISARLVTSGQPPAQVLAGLGAQGYGAVVYLAPPSVPDAVADEDRIVSRQGLVFVHIPIPFDKPSEADLQALAAVLQGLADRKVLVHCQVNMRASSMVFLYRVTTLKEDPRAAYDAVARVWAPDGVWRRFIQAQLRRHGVDFEPF